MLLFNPNGMHVGRFAQDLADVNLEEFTAGFRHGNNREDWKYSTNAMLEQGFRFTLQSAWHGHDLDGVADLHVLPELSKVYRQASTAERCGARERPAR